MPLLGFKPRFVQPILDGIKDQTIRAPRKVPIRLHKPLYLYTGLRTKNAKKIATVLCIDILSIDLDLARGSVRLFRGGFIVECYRSRDELEAFARRDGFASWHELCEFWRQEHGKNIATFQGHVYRWSPLKPA